MVKEDACKVKTKNNLPDRIADRIIIVFIIISIVPILTLLNTSFSVIIDGAIMGRRFNRGSTDWFEGFFTQVGFMSYLKNSILLSSMSITLALIIALPAAYALSRYRFRGINMFSILVVAPLLIPTIAYFLPFAVTVKRFEEISGIKFYNSYNGYIILAIMYAVMYLPFSIWMLRGFIVSVPVEIEEAARVDGCSTAGVLTRILLPLMSSGIIVTAMLLLMLIWDERLLVDVLMTSDNMKTVALWPSFDSNRFTAAPLSGLPIFVIFFFVQKNFMKGLTGGALKE